MCSNLVKVFSVFLFSSQLCTFSLLLIILYCFFLEVNYEEHFCLLTEMELKNIFMEDLWYVADYIWIADSKLVLDLSPSKIIDKRDSSYVFCRGIIADHSLYHKRCSHHNLSWLNSGLELYEWKELGILYKHW